MIAGGGQQHGVWHPPPQAWWEPWFRHTSSCRYHAILDYKCSLKL